MTESLELQDHDERVITLKVNSEKRDALVSSRAILADVIRDSFRLTGTHIGCDQGACGACTILIDGVPQRSCIAFAMDCEDAEITTIEGFEDDPTMVELKSAFSEHHGLQCGFCTSGMLVTARDIVLRLGETDEKRVRVELAGNLCRCTGYTGIVDAICATARGNEAVGSSAPIAKSNVDATRQAMTSVAANVAQAEPEPREIKKAEDFPNSIDQKVKVDLSPDDAWAVLRDLKTAASCVPGAEIVSLDEDGVEGRMNITLGPIRAQFNGDGTYEISDDDYEGWMLISGKDAMTGSTATGRIAWSVTGDGSSGSAIDIILAWKLTGSLAQFGRGGIVTETVRRLATMFGENLEQLLRDGSLKEGANTTIGLRSLVWPAIKSSVKQFFGRLIRAIFGRNK